MIRLSGITAAGSILGAQAMPGVQGRELTSEKKLKIIVAGAHPDDPESGCGGTMALLAAAGHEVIAAYLTRGEAGIPGKTHEEAASIRTAEALKACNILSSRAEFLGQIDGSTEITKERYDDVYGFLEKEKPDIVFTHWPIDSHRDHRICSILVYDAWLRMGKNFSLYYFEVETGIQSQNFSPTEYTDISSVINIKADACMAHSSQDPEDFYENIHRKMEIYRGMEYSCDYAEAFIRHNQNPQKMLIEKDYI
jgi:LmbE family N-acetylglucosaminyl deacetylase